MISSMFHVLGKLSIESSALKLYKKIVNSNFLHHNVKSQALFMSNEISINLNGKGRKNYNSFPILCQFMEL